MATRSLGVLTLDLIAKIGGYVQGMTQAERQTKKSMDTIKSSLSSVASTLGVALSAGAFTAWIKGSIDAADEASKLSQRLGVSVETVTGLKLGLDLAGNTMGEFSGAMQRLAKASKGADEDIEGASTGFAALGIEVRNQQGDFRTLDDLLFDISDKFAGMEDGLQKAALAQEFFGRSGGKLIPFLNEGREGLEDMIQKSRDLGLVWDQESATAAEDFNDNLTVLQAMTRGYADTIARDLLPQLTALTTHFVSTDQAAKDTSSGMGLLQIAVATLATGSLVLGDGLTTIYQRMRAIAGSVGPLLTRDFEAWDKVWADFEQDTNDRLGNLADTIDKLWGTAGSSAQESAQKQIDAYAEILKAQQKAMADAASAQNRIDAGEKYIATLQKQIDVFGLNTEAVRRYELAQSDLEPQARATAEALLSQLEGFERQKVAQQAALKAAEELKRAQDELLRPLREQVATFDLSSEALRRYQIEQSNLPAGAREAALALSDQLAALEDQKLASEEAAKASEELQRSRDRGAQDLQTVIEGLRTEEEAIQESYRRRLEIIRQNTEAGSVQQAELITRLREQTAEIELEAERKHQADLLAVQEEAAAAKRDLQLAQLEAVGAFFGTLGELAAEGSKAQRVLFAAEKAAALAQSLIALQVAIAKANSIGFPANIAAIAKAAAIGAGAISSIRSVNYGGARAEGGSVLPGKSYLVGERGPEMFTPSGTGNITPNDALGSQVHVTIIENPQRAGTVERDDNTIRIFVARVKAELAADIGSGRGIAQNLQQTYGLRRVGSS